MESTYFFFKCRRRLNLGKVSGVGRNKQYAEYANVPLVIGILISNRMATLHELDTHYGVKDAYDLLEVVRVDNYNNNISK